ncbi:UDP-glucuronic acid decarboxylase family protein [Saccharomonospora viridis]|jgi:dTDP-glucose 4,6-dehydratase|uniref:Nucleoside-diphosphate-sugar epimerase n=2 Tax=Saccharomonospora viridis TaxID=1852 RepID=C7MZ63_SACVD|nr:UDP-glucuronic acid decarboxylase family protein [Saccharomonospora viridis]ACU96184.1 nucleoside-diphosphate-sugar epimerase [Saccharomonospora viridis DSM 43017]KHF45310.1 epimerase [Saccharomonospora viridis]SFP79559.1 dTDP-glucose 4,6-dehydratase [Saccharomonospora viridis]
MVARGEREHVLVVGGAGFIGSHVCQRLLRSGHRVTCVDSLVTGSVTNVASLLDDARFRFVELDVTLPLPRWPDLGTPDSVLNLASPASPKDYQRLPIETLRTGSRGTEHTLELAVRHGARFVLTSTSEVYGDPLEHPQRETYWGNVNPIGPRSVYDEAKRYAEALTMAYHRELGADVAIARVFNTYGPRMRTDDGRMIPNFITQALSGAPLTVAGSGTQTRSVCYVDDTVTGLLALWRSGLTGPVNIGNPHELTVGQVAEEIRRITRTTSPVISIPGAVDDPRRRCPDITVARTQLGWSPEVGLHEGLRRTIAWFAASTEPVSHTSRTS